MKFLRRKDWDEISDIDYNYAFEKLYKKSDAEVYELLRKSTLSIIDCLRFTNVKPYQSLMLAINNFFWAEKSDFEDIHLIADALITEVRDAVYERPEFIVSLMPALMPTIEFIVAHQIELGADIDIYGNYELLLNEINQRGAE